MIKVPVKALEGNEAGPKSPFLNTFQLFSFLAKLNFLKDSFATTLYLLDFFEFSPTFGLFHYANLPSYKRVT